MNDLLNGLKELWSSGQEASKFRFGIAKATLLAIIITFCMQIIGSVINLPAMFWKSELFNVTLPMSFAAGGVLAIFVALPLANTNWSVIRKHVFKPVSPVLIFIGILFFASVLPFAEFLTSLVPTDNGGLLEDLYNQFTDAFEMMTTYKVAGFITVCILAPILEEILFRGIILRGMLQKGISPAIAIGVSAFLFGVAHLNPWQFLGAGVLGIALGYIYYRTKSLWFVMLLHALNNTVSYILMIYIESMDYDVTDTENYSHLGLSLVICGVLGWLIYNSTKNTAKWT